MIKVTFEKSISVEVEKRNNYEKVEDNNKITQNVEKRRFMHRGLKYMNRVGGFLLQRQDMVIAYAHVHKTAIW